MNRSSSLFFLFIFISVYSYGQICNGNLGENIFLNGDFGSGRANVLTPDPRIAPGYIYQRSPPPDDGYYTITNNTSTWGSFAWTWDNIRDNSSDPFGYMMIVNASFEPGLFYQQQVDGLCENTLYQFTVDVYNLVNGIQPNILFQLDGTTQHRSGNVPYNRRWNTYGFTFTTAPGQTSLTLSISNNAPGGQGNDLALDNISFRACGPEALILPQEIASICEDGNPIDLEATIVGNQYNDPQLQWQRSTDAGITWTDIPGATQNLYQHALLAAGKYHYRYLLANNSTNLLNPKCRVVSNVKIVHVVPKFYTIIDTICDGKSFNLGENEYTNSGIYEDSLITSNGCDSIVTLELTVLPDPNIQFTLLANDPSCSYLDDGNIELTSITNANPPYTLLIDDTVNSTGGNLNNLNEGEYTYSVMDKYGCTADTTIRINSPDPFVVDLGPDQVIELGDILSLTPYFSDSVDKLTWSTGEKTDCNPQCPDLNILLTQSQFLSVSAISTSGCISKDSIWIEIDNVQKVFAPNAFSPNGDGINDYFTIQAHTPNVHSIEELSIFNRWGELIFRNSNFQPNDPQQGWDGRNENQEQITGVYVYKAIIRFLNGSVFTYSGELTLVE